MSYISLTEKAFIRRIKKSVLSPTPTLILVLHAKQNDVFHCLYKVRFWWGWGKLGLELAKRASQVNPSLPQTHQKLTFIQLLCLIVQLLVIYWGHCQTNSQTRKVSGTGRIATSLKITLQCASCKWRRHKTVLKGV